MNENNTIMVLSAADKISRFDSGYKVISASNIASHLPLPLNFLTSLFFFLIGIVLFVSDSTLIGVICIFLSLIILVITFNNYFHKINVYALLDSEGIKIKKNKEEIYIPWSDIQEAYSFGLITDTSQIPLTFPYLGFVLRNKDHIQKLDNLSLPIVNSLLRYRFTVSDPNNIKKFQIRFAETESTLKEYFGSDKPDICFAIPDSASDKAMDEFTGFIKKNVPLKNISPLILGVDSLKYKEIIEKYFEKK